MTETAILSGLVTSVKAASEIAKAFREGAITKAEMNLKLAELMHNLADAKMATTVLQGLIHEKDKEITRLTSALEIKAKVMQFQDAYYLQHADGRPRGAPFCLHCWECKARLVHLIAGVQGLKICVCPSCKTEYRRERSQTYQPV